MSRTSFQVFRKGKEKFCRNDGCIWEINLLCSKISSMARDQFQRLTSNLSCFIPRDRRQIWNDEGGGLSKRSDIQRWHSRIFCEAIDGVFSLHNICTQICGRHREIQRMQSDSRCKERRHLQLSKE